MLYDNFYSDVLGYFNIDRVEAFFAFLYIVLHLVVFTNLIDEPGNMNEDLVPVVIL